MFGGRGGVASVFRSCLALRRSLSPVIRGVLVRGGRRLEDRVLALKN